jgi:hypothetical protein
MVNDMSVSPMRIFLLTGLYTVAAVGWAGPKAATPAEWKTYRSPDYGFVISYPGSMTFFPGHPVEAPELSMFPICDDTTVACFQYHGDAFNGTTLQAAGVSVNVPRDLKSETECNTIDTGSSQIKTVKIHGALFHYGDTGEGGLGSSRGITAYRTFYQHVCFEAAVVIAVTDTAPGHEEEEGYKPVNQQAWRRLSNDMDRMLHSLTFIGPVRDGPDWDVYSDWGCGATFEYPSTSALQKVVEYSNEAYDSSRITCEQSFAYKDRDYTVMVKVNLRRDDAVDEWLSSSGYPRLEQMEVLAKYDGFTEYGDQIHTYIRFQNDLFIFTVSGASRQPIRPEGDRVFAHLMKSFRVK